MQLSAVGKEKTEHHILQFCMRNGIADGSRTPHGFGRQISALTSSKTLKYDSIPSVFSLLLQKFLPYKTAST